MGGETSGVNPFATQLQTYEAIVTIPLRDGEGDFSERLEELHHDLRRVKA